MSNSSFHITPELHELGPSLTLPELKTKIEELDTLIQKDKERMIRLRLSLKALIDSDFEPSTSDIGEVEDEGLALMRSVAAYVSLRQDIVKLVEEAR